MWADDQLKVWPPVDRIDWEGASLPEKLAYEKRAREFIAKAEGAQ